MTITMIIWVLVVVSATIIGVFYYILTLQKRKQFGIMKAIGLGMGRLAGMLSELDVEKCKNQYPAKMSGGEKQRIAIARAFVNDPDIILADEPTASLDGTRGHQVVEMIRMEVKKHDKAAVMVTHDERALHLADQVYHLKNGKLTQ